MNIKRNCVFQTRYYSWRTYLLRRSGRDVWQLIWECWTCNFITFHIQYIKCFKISLMRMNRFKIRWHRIIILRKIMYILEKQLNILDKVIGKSLDCFFLLYLHLSLSSSQVHCHSFDHNISSILGLWLWHL